MSEQAGPAAAPSWTLAPEQWRTDLLRIVLRVLAIFGGIVYLPSVVFASRAGAIDVVVLDTVAIVAVVVLARFDRIPPRVRAFGACAVLYGLGVGLLITIGSISQIYLFGFSLLTTMLSTVRWGAATVVVNAVTMLAIGYLGIAAPEMVVPQWQYDLAGWAVITANFVLVNASLVLALGGVLHVLETALARSVETRMALERKQATLERESERRARDEASLRSSKALLRIAGQTARLGGWSVELGAPNVQWSDEVCALHEMPVGTSPTLAEAVAFYEPAWRQTIGEAVARCFEQGAPFDLEAEIRTAGGTTLWVRAIGDAVRDAAGVVTHVQGSIQDITAPKAAEARHQRLEEQNRQMQKMETVGSLAGGIAHDFNNLMSVVLSYSELIAEDLPSDSPTRGDVLQIRDAALRAAALTRQLLAFSAQQVLEPKVVELGAIVVGTEKMLRRVIGEDIELVTSCAEAPGLVRVDAGQIEQVIMNLAVNARDAMPTGGKLTLETSQVTLDQAFASRRDGVEAGPHVMLAVSDSGTGMDKATQARMFEPFFTTKPQGKGTGLGLATVFGIVRQSGGTIWVYSELGVGTTFKIYFPTAHPAAMASDAAGVDGDAVRGGSETILLVDDDDAVRGATRAILRKHGYRVLEAQNGGEAFLLSEGHAASIDILLTDVVMPRMSGRQLAERIQARRPETKVLYMSGYTDDAVMRHGILSETLAFIQKPFAPDRLARKVRDVLDGRRAASPSMSPSPR